MASLGHDDDLIGPPTGPEVGSPIPDKIFGNVPKIVPDDPPHKVDTPSEAEARVIHRALRAMDRGPWGRGGPYY